MRKQRLTITLGGDDYDALSTLAIEEERSLSWVINQAVRQFLSGKGIQKPLPMETAGRKATELIRGE